MGLLDKRHGGGLRPPPNPKKTTETDAATDGDARVLPLLFLLQANRCALAVPLRSFFRSGVDQEVSV